MESILRENAQAVPDATEKPKRRLPLWIIYLLPSMLVFLIFTFYPFVKTLVTSLFSTTNIDALTQFIGVSNYTALFTDPKYLQCLGNTLKYILLTVPLTVIISLLLAVLSCSNLPGMGVFRTIFSSTMGISVAAGSVWMNIGFSYLVLMGGLKNIDDSHYESVEIVGGGFFYRLFKVTVPLISPSLFFVITTSLIGACQPFGLIDMLTSGGPNNSTNLLVYRLYKDAFVNFRIGSASAQGVVLFILILLVSQLQTKLTERLVTYQ